MAGIVVLWFVSKFLTGTIFGLDDYFISITLVTGQKPICFARDIHAVIDTYCSGNYPAVSYESYSMEREGLRWVCVIRISHYICQAFTNFNLSLRYIWGGTSLLMLIWAYFWLPETWNRPYEELDILFAEKVPAREFAITVVDPIGDSEDGPN